MTGGGHARWGGGIHGRDRGMFGGGMHGRGACMAGGHAWCGEAYVAGGVHSRGHVWQGDMHGRLGMCGRGGGMHGRGVFLAGGCAWQILRDAVNERAVRILLECILVIYCSILVQCD